MFKALWKRIRNWFETNSETKKVYKEFILTEYKSVFYTIHRASNLNELLAARQRLRNFQQLLIENRLHHWGREYVIDLTKLWNAKYKYWKNKVRKQ